MEWAREEVIQSNEGFWTGNMGLCNRRVQSKMKLYLAFLFKAQVRKWRLCTFDYNIVPDKSLAQKFN